MLSLSPGFWTRKFGQKDGSFVQAHCRVSQPICQAKKVSNRLERFWAAENPASIALRGIPVQK
jgi:hypothetical protein